MPLTPEQVSAYEARAAAGEKPVLPWIEYLDRDWLVSWMAVVGTCCRIYKGDADGNWHAIFSTSDDACPISGFDGRDWMRSGYFDTIPAAQLFLEDQLAAFAAPLREREVPGPWWAFEGHDGTWYVAGICPPMTNLVPLSMCTECHDAAEARAIANVRNLFHARRQAKEASRVD